MPGSGKTTLGKKLQKKYHCPFIDDISIGDGFERLYSYVLDKTPHIIISDVFFCRAKTREVVEAFFKRHKYKAEWIFFENNVEKCLKNVHKRNDGRKVEGLINQLSKEYAIPDGTKIRKIHGL